MTSPRCGSVVSPHELTALRACLDEVQRWPAGSHIWGHYAEEGPRGPIICRTENVSACVPLIAELVDGALQDVATDALGEPAAAFKDKVNYKQPGGAGFSPHQDLPAYPGVDRVVSVLLAVDDCDEVSGCLWLAEPATSVLPVDERGVVREAEASNLDWEAAPLRAGEAVLIDGLAPHYSEANRSDHARRVLVVSYAPTAAAYSREQYYEARATAMNDASARDGKARISTLDDFEGRQLAPERLASGRCVHF